MKKLLTVLLTFGLSFAAQAHSYRVFYWFVKMVAFTAITSVMMALGIPTIIQRMLLEKQLPGENSFARSLMPSR